MVDTSSTLMLRYYLAFHYKSNICLELFDPILCIIKYDVLLEEEFVALNDILFLYCYVSLYKYIFNHSLFIDVLISVAKEIFDNSTVIYSFLTQKHFLICFYFLMNISFKN